MIKRAPTKIIISFCLLVLGITCCIVLDQVFQPTDKTVSQAYGSPDEASLQQDDLPSSTEVLTALSQDHDASPVDLAQSYFDISLEAGLPEAFQEECLEEADFASAYSSGSVIGLVFDGDTNAAKQHCEQLLAKKGWKALADNNELVGSFFRPQGTYRWLVLQYFARDETTVIVANVIDID